MQLIQDLLSSRKAQGTLLLVLIVVLGERVGLTTTQVEMTADGLIAYVLGRAIVDHGLAKSSS